MSVKRDRSYFWLGRYLTLALTLPALVAAGYIIGSVADHRFHLPILRALGIMLGIGAGIVQVLKEISRDEKRK